MNLTDEGRIPELGPELSGPDDLSVPLLLITANVGSLFEDPARLLHPWIREFLRKVTEVQPQFLALHLQEVGGKTYEKSMECVQKFIRCLCEANEMQDFASIRIYMDEDFHSAEHFTALGNLYFVHKNVKSVRIWNFLTHEWETANNKNIYSGNIESIASKEKSKFPQHFFPECKWSRKGFMRTRWEINWTVFDLVNIHLFHDASNLAACEEFPSVYCKTRRRALVYTLERFHLDDKNGCAPYFLFGDFNFRCDTEGVIKELTENLTAHRIQSIKTDSTKVHYRNSVGNNVLTIGKKEFNHADHQLKFKESWLKKFDKELDILNEILVEYSIDFPPSYPYEEDPEMPTDYMSTRCPSWCDRILMNPQAKELIVQETIKNPYNIIGENVCMGDHKPIYLYIRLKPNQGTYRCCKCYLNNANNNKTSSIHQNNPAAVTSMCPYRNSVYRKFILDCKKEINVTPRNSPQLERTSRNFNSPRNATNSVSSIDAQSAEDAAFKIELPQLPETIPYVSRQSNEKTAKCPPVSINLIDSDNIYVCMCSQITNASGDDVDGAICPECSNTIKKQSLEHRYRLVSKRLMLPNNIIVNRIDTQYLNTCNDPAQSAHRPDPYTPESAESHSPCPELNSTTTTSSNGHSSYGIGSAQRSATETVQMKVPLNNEFHPSTDKLCDDVRGEQQFKGVVSPGQLKSRLEDLQKSCSHLADEKHHPSAVGVAPSASTVATGEAAAAAAAGEDNDEDDDIFNANASINTTHRKHNNKTCFPKCCKIH